MLAAALTVAALLAPAPRAHAGEAASPVESGTPAPPPAGVVVAATPSPCAGGHVRRVRVEVQVHAAQLRPDPQGLLTLDSGTPGQASWDAVDYVVGIGGRLAATFPCGPREVRLAATWWGTWADEQLVSGTIASTATPGGPLNVTATDLGVSETARLLDCTIASMRPGPGSGALATRWGWGARFLRFREEGAFLFPTTVPVANAAVFESDVTCGLLAAEACAEATWRLGRGLEVRARGAVFAGWMRRSARVATVNVTPPPVDPTDVRHDLGWGAEAEVALAWRARPGWSVSVGYGVLFLGPVSRAHDVLDFSSVASSDLGPALGDGTLLAQRLFLGLDLRL